MALTDPLADLPTHTLLFVARRADAIVRHAAFTCIDSDGFPCRRPASTDQLEMVGRVADRTLAVLDARGVTVHVPHLRDALTPDPS